jgi:hypothetical protein
MKFLRYFLFLLSAGIIFTSCQKEYSAETGSAQGTLLKDAAGDCTAAVSGAYKKDTVLTTANFVDVQIDISQAGVYIITTDTVNGYSFRGAGSTALLGLNTIRLIAQGKPLATGTDVFTVKFGGTSCQFNVNVTLGTGGGGGTTAKFTFPNTAGACAGAIQTPNFFATIPTTPATHNITLKVDVTTAGTYNLTTTSANGLIFSGSGTLAIGTNQPIVLTPVAGSFPTAAGTTTYTFSTTTPVASNCAFDLIVQAAPTPATFTINCATAATQTGTFQAGTALTLASKITLSVTPTTTGSYSITTNTVNGVSYVGAGVFANTTTQNVDLFANPLNNTPANAGPFNYTATGGTTPCTTVSVTYTSPPPTSGFIKANIEGATTFTTFNNNLMVDLTPFLNQPSVQIIGDINPTGPGNIDLSVTVPLPGVQTNVDYSVSALTGLFTFNYEDLTGATFLSDNLTSGTLPNPFKVRFSTITANRVVGTFSGALYDNMGAGPNSKTFTNGSFDITF